MYKRIYLLFFLTLFSVGFGQEKNQAFQRKKLVYTKAEIQIDSVALNPNSFKIYTFNNQEIDTSFYRFDYQTKKLLFKKEFTDSVRIEYSRLPNFLTKTYAIYDDSKIVPNEAGQLLTFSENNKKPTQLFNGLQTNGSISRGITVGNNQNTVLNSNLDLQISGKLSDNVTLKASIQDSNIPLQEGGYSQKLDEFDQIFIELSSKNWNVRAGDLFLENRKTSFLNFNKKVQGLSSHFNWGNTNKNDLFFAASLVRGQYARSNFTGQEGNQGPYKLRGNNNELYVLIISGSERVYVNGILKERGENKDYIIDYNAGEIIFNATFPITSEMRIVVEYQYSDRNFTRFLSYGGYQFEGEKFSIGTYVYSENDVKNQPLQQNLSEEQVQILQAAGDNQNLMNAPSAYEDSYSENKILYKKTLIGLEEIFEFSTDPTQTLYQVKFTFVGNNQGNYVLASNNTIGKIYEYIAPIAGIPQGNYEPIVKLIAPTKIQIATIVSSYAPTEKTNIDAEIAISNNDKNLYSDIDDANNQGFATKLNIKQQIFSKGIAVNTFGNINYIQENFKPIERLYNIEFNRDWNITNPLGNQVLLTGGLEFNSVVQDSIKWITIGKYQFEKLDYSTNFSGNKHSFTAIAKNKTLLFQTQTSLMNSKGDYSKSDFFRNHTVAKYHFQKNYIGGSVRNENSKELIAQTQTLSNFSQRFTEFGNFIGRGDSTKVFTEIGYLVRNNDSIQNNILQRVNTSFSSYLKSQLIKNDRRSLGIFFNYRTLKFTDGRATEPSINSRLNYSDSFFNQLIQTTTFYENVSGSIAQQEFTYLEVDPGRGVYMWNDYNNNNIQELQEFEIATFPDLAKYVKIFLPNQTFLRTYQNKLSQTVTFNGNAWQNETGFKKVLSKFYNQTSLIIDKKIARNSNSFEWNPFTKNEEDLIGLNNNFRNSLFYNKGKQKHSTTYTYISSSIKNLLNFGSQENYVKSHQLQYVHLVKKFWLFQVASNTSNSESVSDNYATRNFKLKSWEWTPKISYLFSQNASWDIFYENNTKENTIGNLEKLQQQVLGTSFNWNTEKGLSMSGMFNYINNDFTGNATSPVGFQLLEGLQKGKNTTWQLLFRKNITQFLDISINYQGRKSETSKSIHTGTIQLRAFF
ncbi:hypothetical protein [Flavobacterium urocaniciphilum]|uniref:Outer membrane protein beta-barrel family protein n=1 Tax=Flavobacterium urocaniciphilum TaxID=1299341 RepID=A0A1H9DGY5_9FLAO|nr:hypothetical protein [Flavobacterium urocaniciphilum]SEQ12043.1 hypothetical protein SAMN05444005_1079 [Flavobacterium urocaniciphilum]